MPALDLWPTSCPRCLSSDIRSTADAKTVTHRCNYCALIWDKKHRETFLIHTSSAGFRELVAHIEREEGKIQLVPDAVYTAGLLDQRRRLTERYVLLLTFKEG